MKRHEKELKDYFGFLLVSSVLIIFIGIGLLIMTPILKMWGIEPERLKFLEGNFPSGYVVMTVGLLVQIIANLHKIIPAIKGIKK